MRRGNSPSIEKVPSLCTSLVLCVAVHLRENCLGGPPGMSRQPGAWRQHGKEDLGDESKQCVSAPRSWYVFKADVLPWCAWQ